MIHQVVEYTAVLVVFLYLFYGFIMLKYHRGSLVSSVLFGSFFILIGLSVLDVYAQSSEFYLKHNHLAFILNTIPLLFGPVLWLLSKAVIRPKDLFRSWDFLHFVPYFISVIAIVLGYHIQSVEFKAEFITRAFSGTGLVAVVPTFLLLASIAVYVRYSFLLLKRYRVEIRNSQSDIEKINLEWLEHVLLGFVTIGVITTVIQVFYFLDRDNNAWVGIVLFGLLLFLFYYILNTFLKSMQSHGIFQDTETERISSTEGNTKEVPLLIKSSIDQRMVDALKDHMDKTEAYLEPSISLNDLAKQVGMKPRVLSQVINQGFHKSFFDFINGLRISHAQKLIEKNQDEKQTILEVMYASGFNSKSSFNTAFKKHSGFTPTMWKNTLNRK